jgi:hypothetical protein
VRGEAGKAKRGAEFDDADEVQRKKRQGNPLEQQYRTYRASDVNPAACFGARYVSCCGDYAPGRLTVLPVQLSLLQ